MEGRHHRLERRFARAAVRACPLIALLVAVFLAGHDALGPPVATGSGPLHTGSGDASAALDRAGVIEAPSIAVDIDRQELGPIQDLLAADDPSLPELDSYLAQLPVPWRERAESVIRGCETQSAHQIPILLLSYFPVVGTPETGLFLDPNLTGTNMPLEDMRARTVQLTQHARWALELGSSYHGVTRDDVRCSLEYDVAEAAEHLEALPVSSFQIPWNPGIFRPDYTSILQRHDICDLVDRVGVREVWLWGYHHGNIEPAESNMAGPYGDISNSERVADMPVCDRTYTLYNYNFTRLLGEAVEDHGHQLEAVFRHLDTDGLFADWTYPYGNPAPTVNSCGTVHSPPNTYGGYDWRNPAVALTDCLDWNPQHTGAVTSVSCADWTCNDDGGATFKVWWMMNMPGYQNGLTLNGVPVRDWWEVIADFDAVMASGTGLLAPDTTPPDTTPPDTTIDAGPSGLTADSTPTFSFSASEAATFQCRIDAGAFAACTSPHTTATLTDGAHTIAVRAIDAAGNTDPSPASRSFTVDTTAPQTTINSGPTGPTADPTPTFAFSASAAAGFQCRIDAGAYAACTSPHTTATLTDGAHTIAVRAIDAAGNTDPTPATRSFTVDTTAPQTTIDSGPSGLTADSTPTFTFSASEAATFQCRIDAGAYAACTSPHTTATLADGAHTIAVRAIDAAGNTDPTPATRSFTVDATAPQTAIDSGPSGPTADSTPTFEFSSNEPGSRFECQIDAGGFFACTSPFTTRLVDGDEKFEVRAIDTAGNKDATPAIRTFTIDTVQPETTIDSGGPEQTADSTLTFEFSSDEFGSSFECRVDSDAFRPCSSPHTTASLPDGAHRFDVKATDRAGNTDPTPDSRSFTVDTTAPQTTIDSGPAGPTADPSPTFAFSASEPGVTFAYRLDGGAFYPCSSPHTVSALADGTHTFEVRAVDGLGNADPTPASRTFTLDTAPPETTIDSCPADPTTDSAPTFEFSSSEPGCSFICRVDEAALTPCGSPFTTGVLADGRHSFEVQATDALGNTDPTPAACAFTLAPAAGAPEDTTVTLTLSAKRRQKVLKQRGVVVKAACGSEATSVTATGNVPIPGRKQALGLKPASRRVPAGRSVRVRLGLSKKARTAIAKALRRQTLKAKITVTAQDAAGNTAHKTITAKLIR
jgi:hypothetical protein